jgi:chemotaxis protein histidine kinase CheA
LLWEQALQDFSLNLPRQLAQPIADAKSLESVRSISSSALRGASRQVTHGRNWTQVPLAKGDKEELARLRFDNTALLAVLAISQRTRVVRCARMLCCVCGSIASPLPFRVVQRQEQLERSLQQIGALNEKLAKEKLAQKEELDAAAKKIKNLQQHRDKAKELSDQVESYKEELTRFRKAEAELTKLNAKLKAEVEALAGASPAASASPSTPYHSYTCLVCGGVALGPTGNRDEDQRTRSEMEEMEYTIGVQKEALADLEKSLEEKERTVRSRRSPFHVWPFSPAKLTPLFVGPAHSSRRCRSRTDSWWLR